jgi:hypothetical protein
MAIPKGTVVTQNVEVISGTVTKTQFNESLNELEYLVEYKNSAGEDHSRWFLESQIKAVAQVAAQNSTATVGAQ